mgnify:CR=1 FL=1
MQTRRAHQASLQQLRSTRRPVLCCVVWDRWIKQYQQEGYQLQPVPIIQEYLRTSLQRVNDDDMWQLSLKVRDYLYMAQYPSWWSG